MFEPQRSVQPITHLCGSSLLGDRANRIGITAIQTTLPPAALVASSPTLVPATELRPRVGGAIFATALTFPIVANFPQQAGLLYKTAHGSPKAPSPRETDPT